MLEGKEKNLTHERVLALFNYDPATGIFTNRIGRPGAAAGSVAGFVEANGYRRIMIDRVRVFAHRLAWFYLCRSWPDSTIDHINMRRDDNSFSNLRLATHSQNHANTRPLKSKSGLKGAHWNGTRGHWQSYIRLNGKSLRLGRFATPEDAHAAYVRAATDLHGEFARMK